MLFMSSVMAAEAGMERLFDLDFQLLHDSVLMMIAIFILFIAGSYFLFHPVREMMARRKQRIQEDIEQASQDKVQAQIYKEEYEARLREVEKEAETVMSEARKKALMNENRILGQAKEDAVAILSRASAEAELEKKKAVDDVKKEIVKVAAIMAGKVVSSAMDTKIQDELIEDTLKDIGDATWLS